MQLARQTAPEHGFTLIELVITVAVLGVLIAVAAPYFQDWIHNTQIRTAAESILDGLQNARSEAVKRNGYTQFILTDPAGTSPTSWQVVSINPPLGGANPACQPETVDPLSGLPTDPVLQRRSGSEGSSTANLAITPAGLTTVTFSPLGWVDSANCGASITQIDVGSAVLDAALARPLRIVITSSGGIRLCDPQVVAGNPRACN